MIPAKNKDVKKVSQNKAVEKSATDFEGIKIIQMDQIREPGDLYDRKIETEKINEIVARYKSIGSLDRPIVVSLIRGRYLLKGNYNYYLAAKCLKLEKVPAETGTYSELKERNKLRTIGTRVRIGRKKEEGVVIAAEASKVTIRFLDGREAKYDIVKGLEQGTIEIVKKNEY